MIQLVKTREIDLSKIERVKFFDEDTDIENPSPDQLLMIKTAKLTNQLLTKLMQGAPKDELDAIQDSISTVCEEYIVIKDGVKINIAHGGKS